MEPDTHTTESTRALVTAYVAALQRGDLDELRTFFAPDATWTMRGDLPVSGTWTGPEEILDKFLADVVARLDLEAGVSQTLHRIIADGEYGVAEWTSHAVALSGERYDNDNAVVFQVADGFIQSVVEYTDTAYMERVLFR